MEDKLIELLQTIEPTVIRQGSLDSEADYPDKFFTFWNNNSSGNSHYDNSEVSTAYDYDVNCYSKSPELTYSMLQEAITLLRSEGFIISGDGYDVASDEVTHTGRGVNVLFLKF